MGDERTEAVALADRLLDVPYADPDGDLRILARQLLRRHEEIERLRAALERIVSMSCISGYDSGRAGIEEVAREALRGAVETAPALWRGAGLLQLKCLCCILVET